MASTLPALYPLLVERKLVYRLWGGHHIADWLEIPEPCPANLGETWEIFETNRVRNGPLAGHTLADVTDMYGIRLVGTRPPERYGSGFPLLTKFIDANDCLSLQVHPDDDYALRYEADSGFHGKTEAWYILRAEPGASIICGVNRPIERDDFATAVETMSLDPLLHRVPVAPGDVILVPAGTLHAINAGILLFEIQEKSDLTYRVYDYGRIDPATGTQRALHLDKALDVLKLSPSASVKTRPLPLEPKRKRTLLVACPHFALEEWVITDECERTTHQESVDLITIIDGCGELNWPGGRLYVRPGDSIVIPAALGAWALQPTSRRPLRLFRGYVPDIERDLLKPLSNHGFDSSHLEQVMFDSYR